METHSPNTSSHLDSSHNKEEIELQATNEENPKQATRRSIVLTFSLVTVVVPLLLALLVGTITVLRLTSEYRRVAEIKAKVASSWLADRFQLTNESSWSELLSQSEARLNEPIGLFKRDGSPMVPGHLAGLPKRVIQQIIAKKSGIATMAGQDYAAFATNLGTLKNSPVLIVAAKRALESDVVYYGAAKNLGIVAALLILAASLFGLVFGRNLRVHLVGLNQRIHAMITVDHPPPVLSEEMAGRGLVDNLERAATQLEERFQGELALYKDALDEVQVHNDLRTAFLGAVSIDLQAPLDLIVGQAEQLLTGKKGDLTESQTEDVRIIQQASKRLLSMVESMIDFSSILSKGIEYDSDLVDLAEVADEVIKTARGGIGKKDLKVVFEMEEETLPKMKGSRQRIWQVLTNLVSNGIKFTEQGEVKVTLYREGESGVRVDVSDSGEGIPSSEHEAIFDPFMQRGELKKRIKGTGLGLAICKQLIALHNGDIRVESQVGEGSRFTVILPGKP